jgi:hypothetical protein
MSDITIRSARPTDVDAIRRLAALDSRRVPGGDVLVGEVAGRIVAAHGATGTVADPFLPTADVVALLRVRAGRAERAAGRRRHLLPHLARPRLA